MTSLLPGPLPAGAAQPLSGRRGGGVGAGGGGEGGRRGAHLMMVLMRCGSQRRGAAGRSAGEPARCVRRRGERCLGQQGGVVEGGGGGGDAPTRRRPGWAGHTTGRTWPRRSPSPPGAGRASLGAPGGAAAAARRQRWRAGRLVRGGRRRRAARSRGRGSRRLGHGKAAAGVGFRRGVYLYCSCGSTATSHRAQRQASSTCTQVKSKSQNLWPDPWSRSFFVGLWDRPPRRRVAELGPSWFYRTLAQERSADSDLLALTEETHCAADHSTVRYGTSTAMGQRPLNGLWGPLRTGSGPDTWRASS
eukprot:COSAG04_NODE_159_length_22103_cov_21.289389_3_plen_304_part_00